MPHSHTPPLPPHPTPPHSTHVPVLERIVASRSPSSDVTAAPAYARPKTLPLAYNTDAPTLQSALQSQPHFGQVHVERSFTPASAAAGPGYSWTVTFTSNVGPQPALVVNNLDLLSAQGGAGVTTVSVSKVHPGTLPDNYQSRVLPVDADTPLSTDFSLLTTGVRWLFRVVATNDMGDGPLSLPASAVPAAAPGAPSALTLSYATATSLLATYPQDAPANGAPVTSYLVRVSSARGEVNVTLPVSYKVQQITTSAYRLPFTPDSTYTLSVASYKGKYTVYAPGAAVDPTYRLRMNGGNSNLLNSSTDAPAWQTDLRNFFTPGEFITVAGQEFRVCMNFDPSFVASHGAADPSHQLALCTVADPFVAKALDAGYAGHTLSAIPVMKLDTTVGGAASPTMGSAQLTIQNNDLSVNGNTAMLSVGDWVMVGHPTAGEVFRVKTAGTTTIQLATVDDLTAPASLTYTSLQHATYEVQALTITYATAIAPTTPVGFRVKFRGYTTHASRTGGDFGCLSTASTGAEARDELRRLLSIDDVLVTRATTTTTTTTTVTYQVTFTGALVRGDVPSLQVLDVGTNGCTPVAPTGAPGSDVSTVQTSYVPVYRLQTTRPLAYSASASAVKDALEGLSLVTRAEVSRDVVANGLAWTVTFRGDSTTPIYPLQVNGARIVAAVDGAIAVTPVVQYEATGLVSGVAYYLAVTAQNAYGTGPFTTSIPASKQPVAQAPLSPRQVRAYMQQNSYVDVQFNLPVDEHTQRPAGKTYKAYGKLNN